MSLPSGHTTHYGLRWPHEGQSMLPASRPNHLLVCFTSRDNHAKQTILESRKPRSLANQRTRVQEPKNWHSLHQPTSWIKVLCSSFASEKSSSPMCFVGVTANGDCSWKSSGQNKVSIKTDNCTCLNVLGIWQFWHSLVDVFSVLFPGLHKTCISRNEFHSVLDRLCLNVSSLTHALDIWERIYLQASGRWSDPRFLMTLRPFVFFHSDTKGETAQM